MSSSWVRRGLFSLSLSVIVGVVGAFGFAAGWMSQASQDDRSAVSAVDSSIPADLLAQVNLQADSASTGKTMAMVTGRIDGDVEGLYVLDFTTGNLFCWVLNQRGGGFMAQYMTNVRNDFGPLEQGRNPEYLLVSGFVNVAGGAGADGRPADSVVYVADANSGAVVGYSLVWNRARAAAGGAQGGGLIKVAQGLARDANLIRQ
ncbi:MAG: hypothetical protein R3B96_20690 [Pirellulaceae bacterium]